MAKKYRILKWVSASFVGAGFIAWQIASFSGFVASVVALRERAYPTFFGIWMMIAGATLIIVRRNGIRFFKSSRINKVLSTDEARLEKPMWRRVRRFGELPLTIAAFLIAGPLFAALAVRILGLPESIAWRYVFIAAIVSVIAWITFCLYGIDLASQLLASAAASRPFFIWRQHYPVDKAGPAALEKVPFDSTACKHKR